jgi:type I restriction enzyme S subunit
LPPAINPPCKTIQELGIELNSENRNPEKSPAEEFIYVDLSSVDHNVIESLKRIKGSEAPSRARRVIRENDVILSTVRPYLGGHAVVPETLDNQICSTGFSVLRCPDHVNPRFLYFRLISPQVVAQFHSCMRGSHYPALNDDHVRNLLIPDLSRDKQDEIVGKLENLIEQIEASVTRIEAFSQLLNGEANAALSSLMPMAHSQKKRNEESISDLIRSSRAGSCSSWTGCTWKQTSRRPPVRSHLNRAIELLSDRTSPDYRNAIKESISLRHTHRQYPRRRP